MLQDRPTTDDADKWRGIEHCRPGFLDGAPVKALGVYGLYYFYQDALGDYRALHLTDLEALPIVSLFSPAIGWLTRLWPRRGPNGEPDGGWDVELAQESLICACGHAGIVDPIAYGFRVDWSSPPGDRRVFRP